MIEKPTDPFEWAPGDVDKYYHAGLTGYTGLDYHSVAQLTKRPAMRAQMGGRGLYKRGWPCCRTATFWLRPSTSSRLR